MKMQRTLLGDILGADVTVMRTPELVREFVANRTAWARGETCTARQHSRHQRVVTELRSRGVLD